MFQLVKIIDSSAPHQGDIRCFKKMGVKQSIFGLNLIMQFIITHRNYKNKVAVLPHRSLKLPIILMNVLKSIVYNF